MMREAVAHEPQSTTLHILLDWIERLLLGDLHLCIGPARDLDDHVENAIMLISKERNVMEGREDCVALLDIHPMICTIDEFRGIRIRFKPTKSVRRAN